MKHGMTPHLLLVFHSWWLLLTATATISTAASSVLVPPLELSKDVAAELVIIIADQRTSSTEQAENIASHPCGYSFNE